MTNQLVLDETPNGFRLQPLVLLIPSICAIISVVSLLVQKYLYDLDVRRSVSARSLPNASVIPASTRLTSSGFPLAGTRRAKISQQENRINLWKILRLVACLVLVTLSIVAIAMAEVCPKVKPGKPGKQDDLDPITAAKYGFGKHHKKKKHPVEICFTQEQLVQLSLGAFYASIFVCRALYHAYMACVSRHTPDFLRSWPSPCSQNSSIFATLILKSY